jgi:hypothetical protein
VHPVCPVIMVVINSMCHLTWVEVTIVEVVVDRQLGKFKSHLIEEFQLW